MFLRPNRQSCLLTRALDLWCNSGRSLIELVVDSHFTDHTSMDSNEVDNNNFAFEFESMEEKYDADTQVENTGIDTSQWMKVVQSNPSHERKEAFKDLESIYEDATRNTVKTDVVKLLSREAKDKNNTRKYSRYFGGSQVRKQVSLDSKMVLEQDVPTRWNSTYLILQSALYYRRAWCFLELSDNNFKHCPCPRGSTSTSLPSSSGGGDTITDMGSDIFTTDIIQMYLDEPKLEMSSNLNVLEFWKVIRVRYPNLSIKAHDILSISVSKVASEAAFSVSCQVLDQFHSLLKLDEVEVYGQQVSKKFNINTSRHEEELIVNLFCFCI
ncbi:hypothetical protein Ddye_008792 [Dipteronia dyeriana]|uniref:HAT C-terminal dimerisation domain-containing protein n=1 Tax=Dipteronia dyeriana TaxID=168575 RepID=A0AAD9XA62_9ROSI|nr:hypothetical protein Ddye_008792 [Dipteronia dyeriana]